MVTAAVAFWQLDSRTEAAAQWARIVRDVRPDISITLYLKSLQFAELDFRNKLRAPCDLPDLPTDLRKPMHDCTPHGSP
ncbi:hypothetical protein [Alitabrizicola rongguiensis]|uniref:hypothetical protein n=1 Tax=Alitabrizicola rongguiensis TaxID=2909234 RepID=UPI001F1EAA98|nr:hypothetical protein [Tabrizicola rongguiensis]